MHPVLQRICAAVMLLGAAALAQTTGSIIGSVTDPTGAVLAGAEIIAINDATGQPRKALSDSSGNFSLPVLIPGRYKVTVKAPGFRSAVIPGVIVAVTEAITLTARLQVGGAGESVTVTAVPSPLRTDSPQRGRTVPGSALASLPLATRNFSQTLALEPGVSAFLPDATGVGRNTQVVEVNGARPTQNNYRVNGVDGNTLGTNGPALVGIPAPESIQEFKVQTSLYDAGYGRAGGANVQVLTRSGSDQFHGSAYEFLRNELFNANDSFLKSAHVKRPVLRRNVFGGTLGGALRPHTLFFFVSYQGTRERNGASLLNSISSHVSIAPGLTNDRSAAAIAAAFAPRGAIDSRSLALLQARLPDGSYLIPTPGADGTYTASTPSTFFEDQFNVNLDWHLRTRDVLTAKLFFANTSGNLSLPSFRGSGADVPGFGSRTEFDNRVVSLQQVHTFTARTINEARVGYTLNRNNTSPDEPITDAEVGIARSTADAYPGLPLIRIAANSGGLILGTAPAIDGRAAAWTWTAADVLTLVRGKHNLRVGGELRFNGINYAIPNFSRGQIDFSDFASFLLGQVQSSTLGSGLVGRNWRAQDHDFFLQDDWRPAPHWTLNWGLRYELDLPVHDTRGRLYTFDPGLYAPRLQVSGGTPLGPPIGGFVQAGNVTPGRDLASVPNVSDSVLYSTDISNLAPRAGFAWAPAFVSNFVVRGGYGIFYSRPTFQYASLTDRLPPDYVLAVRKNSALANPFFSLPPASGFPTFVEGVSLAGSPFDRRLRTPMFEQFGINLQYEAVSGLVLEAGYSGSRGHNLFRQIAINTARLAGPASPVSNPVTGATITTNTPANAVLRAPLQGVSINGFTQNQSSGESVYNSLQASALIRLTHGLNLTAAYTLSKSIDDGSGQGGGAGPSGLLNTSTVGDTGVAVGSPQDPRWNRGLSDFDRTHVFTTNFTWALPAPLTVGHGRALLQGWELSGIVVAMSGSPIDIVDTTAGSLYGVDKGSSALARPNLAPGATCATAMSNVPAGYYFNPSAFASPVVLAGAPIPSSLGSAVAAARGTDIGDVGRNCLRGPVQANVDFALGRGFRIAEGKTLRLRADAFNILNRANRANPVSDLAAASATGGSLDISTGTVISGGNFGRIISNSSNPRIVQVSIHFDF